jgi:hypothetical protein
MCAQAHTPAALHRTQNIQLYRVAGATSKLRETILVSDNTRRQHFITSAYVTHRNILVGLLRNFVCYIQGELNFPVYFLEVRIFVGGEIIVKISVGSDSNGCVGRLQDICTQATWSFNAWDCQIHNLFNSDSYVRCDKMLVYWFNMFRALLCPSSGV